MQAPGPFGFPTGKGNIANGNMGAASGIAHAWAARHARLDASYTHLSCNSRLRLKVLFLDYVRILLTGWMTSLP
jgi:hypothetical protein